MRQLALILAMAGLLISCGKGDQAKSGAAGAVAKPAEAPKAAAAKANAPPPALAIAAWFGSDPLTLEGLKGKVVVVDFWNTTCGPCRKLMPHLEGLYSTHKAEGLVVIGVTEDDKADLEEFLKKNPVAYPIAADALKGGAGQTFDAYKIGSIPTLCLIARDGSLAWKGPGDKLTDDMVLAELKKK